MSGKTKKYLKSNTLPALLLIMYNMKRSGGYYSITTKIPNVEQN